MKRAFIIIVLFQVLLLAGIIVYRQYWVANGDRILLAAGPADAGEIKGDYVTLNYSISSLDLRTLGTDEQFRPKERVYVMLEKGPDNICRAVSVGKVPPEEGKFIQGRAGDELQISKWEVLLRDDKDKTHSFAPRWFSGMIRGDRATFCIGVGKTVLHFDKEDAFNKTGCTAGKIVSGVISDIREAKTRELRVDYGIEDYFVAVGKEKMTEALKNSRDLKVEVSLRKDGKGIITGLFLDGNLLR